MRLVLALLVLSGCDPEVAIVGTVLAEDGGVPPSTRVELSCPGASQLEVPSSTQTDSRGRFSLKGKGCPPSSCTVSTGAGFRRVEQPLMEWCKKSAPGCAPGSCTEASVTLVLPSIQPNGR
jgi:hypothetical protein